MLWNSWHCLPLHRLPPHLRPLHSLKLALQKLLLLKLLSRLPKRKRESALACA